MMVVGEVGDVVTVAPVREERDTDVGGSVEGVPTSMSVGTMDEGRYGGGVTLRISSLEGRGGLGEED